MPLMTNYKQKRATPAGFHHDWTYKGRWNETKIRTGLWKFKFRATKSHKGKRTYGQFGKGTTGTWRINAIQRITKISPNAYQTTMYGTKKPIRFNVKQPNKRYTKWI